MPVQPATDRDNTKIPGTRQPGWEVTISYLTLVIDLLPAVGDTSLDKLDVLCVMCRNDPMGNTSGIEFAEQPERPQYAAIKSRPEIRLKRFEFRIPRHETSGIRIIGVTVYRYQAGAFGVSSNVLTRCPRFAPCHCIRPATLAEMRTGRSFLRKRPSCCRAASDQDRSPFGERLYLSPSPDVVLHHPL